MTTSQAFAEMINKPEAPQILDITPSQRRLLRMRHKRAVLSLEKQMELLLKGGYAIEHDIKWKAAN